MVDMDVEYATDKSLANRQKHGIDFAIDFAEAQKEAQKEAQSL